MTKNVKTIKLIARRFEGSKIASQIQLRKISSITGKHVPVLPMTVFQNDRYFYASKIIAL